MGSSNIETCIIVWLKKYLKTGKDYSWGELGHRLTSYYKFIIVREPMERFLSAYVDKFGTNNTNIDYNAKYGRYIANKYRKSPSKTSVQTGSDVTFREFSLHVCDLWAKNVLGSHNRHWQRYEDICHPCAIRYDFIGKYEILDQDTAYIRKRLNLTHLVRLPRRGAEYPGARTADKMREYYPTLPRAEALRVGNVYSNDSAMFGYDRPDEILRELGVF